jgi:hypothetical protein
MSPKPATPLHAARRQAAKELQLPIDDWRVVRLSTLTLAHETVQAKLASGATIDFGYLLQLDQAIAQVRATSAPPLTVNLKYCKTLTGICPHCKAEVDLGPLPPLDSKSPSEPPKPSPPVSGPPAASASTSTLSASPKPSSSGAKVVPITDYASARDIHTKQTSQVSD